MIYSYTKTNFSDLYNDANWSFKDVNRSQTSYISHGYHRYPAKFIPQIVRKLIKKYTPTDGIVFDPFGGCGTTLVESKILGRKSIGYDINPVAKLITNAKTVAIEPEFLYRSWSKFLEDYNNKGSKNIYPEHSQKTNYWFDPHAIEQLDKIFFNIIDVPNYKIKNFYLCAFSNILKNSSKWLMSSIKPQVDPEKKSRPIFEIFSYQVLQMMKKNKLFYELLKEKGNLNVPARMYLRDSTKKFSIQDNYIDTVITSPPYVTSYEYADLHQLTTYWLADYKKHFPWWGNYADDFHAHRQKFVGTKYGAKIQLNGLMSETADSIIKDLNKNNSKYSRSVNKYFSDMSKSIKQIYRVLSPGGKLCMIIGNTSLTGIEIKNAEVAAEQMDNIGFDIVNVIKRELTNKMIAPFRDKTTGKFTNKSNPNSKRVYKYEYIIVAEKKFPN
jgi:DNA modification methylase